MRGWVRPEGGSSDGVTSVAGITRGPLPSNVRSTSGVPADRMGVVGDPDGTGSSPPGDCRNIPNTKGLTTTDCKDQILAHAMGERTFLPASGDTSFPPFHDRSAKPMAGSFANLAVVNPFSAITDDRAYQKARCPDTSDGCATGVLGKYRALAASMMGSSNSTVTNPSIVLATGEDGFVRGFLSTMDKRDNNAAYELMPPYAVPGLKAAYSSRVPLLGSTPVVAQVPYLRTITDTQTPGDPATYQKWRSVMVSAIGEGSGYFAYDITDPVVPSTLPATSGIQTPTAGPQFLWQAASDPTDPGFRYFGKFTFPPAIGLVQIRDPLTQGGAEDVRQVAVAFLPGGVDGPMEGYPAFGGGLNYSCTRAFNAAGKAGDHNALFEDNSGANIIPKWAPDQLSPYANGCQRWFPGRALYVVEIATGKILRVFTNLSGLASSDQTLVRSHIASDRIIDTPIDAPLLTVTAYPDGIGQITRQLYVGTASGEVWRVDLTDPAGVAIAETQKHYPDRWRMRLFADPYSRLMMDNARIQYPSSPSLPSDADLDYRVREPVVMPPLISLGTKERLVLNIATGIPDDFLEQGVTMVMSLEENLADDGTGSNRFIRGKVNWWQPLIGERVTGPMALFSGALFYATYVAPVGTSSCTSGGARLWARNYEAPYQPNVVGPTGDRGYGGARVSTLAAALFPFQSQGAAVIPGVSVRSKQVCVNETRIDDGTGGASWRVNNVTEGQYELLFTRGQAKQTGGQGQGGVDTASMSLPAPARKTDFAWFGVVNGDLM